MKLLAIENFRLTDRNKAGGDAIFDYKGIRIKADFIFYLQSDQCLSIRVGRHDPEIHTAELEEYINQNRQELKKFVKPDVERVRKEQRMRWGIEPAG